MADQENPNTPAAEERSAPAQSLQSSADAFKRLSRPDQMILGGSALALLLGLLNWYSTSVEVLGDKMTTGVSGFHPWHGKVFFITSLAAVVLVAVPNLRKQLLGGFPEPKRALIILVITAASLIFGPLFFAMQSPGSEIPSMVRESIHAGKTFWFFLAFIASTVAVVGAVQNWKQADAAGG